MEVAYTMIMAKCNTSSDNKRFRTSKTILGSEQDAREPEEDQIIKPYPINKNKWEIQTYFTSKVDDS